MTITPYIDKVPNSEDRVLLSEVEAALAGGALRAAYIMTWIACAESIKRRFREAQTRDSRAGKIVGEIEARERQRKSVDAALIEKAVEYGFIHAGEEIAVKHVYEMRCVYGHPYEMSPSIEQIVAAVDTVVRAVLSNPVMLREGFICDQLRLVLTEKNYLDDYQPAVESYADEISAKIDPALHLWTVNTLLPKAESYFADRTGTLFANRAHWLAVRWLSRVDKSSLGAWDCRSELSANRKIYSSVLSDPYLYPHLMPAVQDTVLGLLLDRSKKAPKLLQRVERLDTAAYLSDRQRERFISNVNTSALDVLQKSGLSLDYLTQKILAGLRSQTWPSQNPAAYALWNCGCRQIAALSSNVQEELGRNILQSADGGSNGAITFLYRLINDANAWPDAFIKGILYECFVDDNLQYRFKNKHIEKAILSLRRIPSASDRSELVVDLLERIKASTPKDYCSGTEERDAACEIIEVLSDEPTIGLQASQLAKGLRSLPGETS